MPIYLSMCLLLLFIYKFLAQSSSFISFFFQDLLRVFFAFTNHPSGHCQILCLAGNKKVQIVSILDIVDHHFLLIVVFCRHG